MHSLEQVDTIITTFSSSYSVMLNCWEYKVDMRPSFAELVENLSSQLVVMAEYTRLFPTTV